MVLLDIIIFFILLGGLILGIKDGFFKKVIGLLGYWTAFIISTWNMDIVAGWLISWLEIGTESAHVLGFAFIFIATVVAVNLFYRWFGRSGADTLSVRSRITGGLIGIFEGTVSASLLLIGLAVLDTPSAETRQDSLFYDSIVDVAPDVFDYSLGWLADQPEFVDEIKSQIEGFEMPGAAGK